MLGDAQSALKNITSLLNVVKGIDRVEDQLRKQNSCTASSSSSVQESTRKTSDSVGFKGKLLFCCC